MSTFKPTRPRPTVKKKPQTKGKYCDDEDMEFGDEDDFNPLSSLVVQRSKTTRQEAQKAVASSMNQVTKSTTKTTIPTPATKRKSPPTVLSDEEDDMVFKKAAKKAKRGKDEVKGMKKLDKIDYGSLFADADSFDIDDYLADIERQRRGEVSDKNTKGGKGKKEEVNEINGKKGKKQPVVVESSSSDDENDTAMIDYGSLITANSVNMTPGPSPPEALANLLATSNPEVLFLARLLSEALVEKARAQANLRAVKEALANAEEAQAVKEAQAVEKAYVEMVERALERLDLSKEATLSDFIYPMLAKMMDELEGPILAKITKYNKAQKDTTKRIPHCKIMYRADSVGGHLLHDTFRPDSCVGILVQHWNLFFPLLTSEYKIATGASLDSAFNQTLGVNSLPFPYLQKPQRDYQVILLVKGLDARFIVRHINHPAQVCESLNPEPSFTSQHPLFALADMSSGEDQLALAGMMAKTIVELFHPASILLASKAIISFRDSGASTGVYPDRVFKTHSYGSEKLAKFHLDQYKYFLGKGILHPFYPNQLITGPYKASTTAKQQSSFRSISTQSQPTQSQPTQSQPTQSQPTQSGVTTRLQAQQQNELCSVPTPSQSPPKPSFSTRFLFTVCLKKKQGTDLDHIARTTPMMKQTMSRVCQLHQAHNVAHNDIRLVNVIHSDDQIMLIDFEYAASQDGLRGLDEATFQELIIELSQLKTYSNFYGRPISDKATAAQIKDSVERVQTELNNIKPRQKLFRVMVLVDLWSVVSMFDDDTAQKLRVLPDFNQLLEKTTVKSLHSSFSNLFTKLSKSEKQPSKRDQFF